MCVTGRAQAAGSWGCLLQPSLFFSGFITETEPPLTAANRSWLEGQTAFQHRLLQIFHTYLMLLQQYPILAKAQMAIFISVSGISKLTSHTVLPVLRHKVLLLKTGEIPTFTEEPVTFQLV